MYAVVKLARFKTIFAVIATAAMVLMFAPGIASATNPDKCDSKNPCDKGYTCNSASKCVLTQNDSSKSSSEDVFGIKTVDTGLKTSLGRTDLRTTAAKIINVALSLLGIVSVVIILIGGFQWMTAGGNEEKVTEARKRIIQGIIGLAIIMSAWAIATFVLRELSTATGSGDAADILK